MQAASATPIPGSAVIVVNGSDKVADKSDAGGAGGSSGSGTYFYFGISVKR
jgi:hypothetical protein